MKYEKPEAEVKDFAAMESNASLGWEGKKVMESTSLFDVEEGVEPRDK